jgi:hypothetical protein
VDISASATRTFFCHLYITIRSSRNRWTFPSGARWTAKTWGTHPILKLPQQFYRGETRAVLELSFWPDVKFIRAHWELNRWGPAAR